jgi:uncharacterized protein
MVGWKANEEVARDITKRIVEICQPERVVLFGSVARGDTRKDSDLDLLVVWKTDSSPNSRERRINLRDMLGFLPISLDLLTCTSTEFQAALQDPKSFTTHIMSEGKTLYTP